MNWSDVARVIGGAAPTVGTLLGGPAGAAVGSLIATALGTQATPEAVNAALVSDPTAIVRIQELQLNAKVELDKIAAQRELNTLQAEAAQYSAEAADRDSARKLAASQPNDLVRPIITFIMLAGALFIVVAVVVGWAMDAITNVTAALTVGNVMGMWFMMTKEVIGFWFGMTKESQKQSAVITDFATQAGTVSKPDKP